MRRTLPIAILLLLGGTTTTTFTQEASDAGGDDDESRRGFTLWVEGEAPAESRMSRHPTWYDRVDRTQLSGGDWISHFKKGQKGIVSYRFRTPGGPLRVLLRANPVRTRLQYQLNRGEWRDVPLDRAKDVRNIAIDGRADLRFIAWIDLGTLDFKRGENRITFRTAGDSAPQHHGAIDALVLTTDPDYEPKGLQKPGDRPEREAPTTRGGRAP